MDTFAWRSPLHLGLAPALLGLALLAPRTALAQTPPAHAERHHVEGLLGIVSAASSVMSVSDPTSGACPTTGCPPSPLRTGLPPRGEGFGPRLGYRFRPVAFFELGVAAEGNFHGESQNYALPLMAYARLPLRDGTGLTLGVGGGIAQARGLEGAHATEGFLRVEVGGVVPLDRAWSIALAVQGSVSAKAAFSSSKTIDAFDEHPEWVGFCVGPRSSFWDAKHPSAAHPRGARRSCFPGRPTLDRCEDV